MRDGIQYFILFLSNLIIIFIKYSSFSLSKFRDLSRTKSIFTVRFILVYDTHCLQRAFHESNVFFLVLKACVCPLICSKYFKSTRSMLPYFNLVPDTKKSLSKSKKWCLVIIVNYLINFFPS